MDTSGGIPALGLDLSDLSGVVTAPGPVATVYLTTEAAVENAEQHSELRWRAVREELAAQGAPDAVLDSIADLVPEAHHSGRCLTVVEGPDGVRLAEAHPEPPARDMGRWAELPSIASLIEWRQMAPAHLVVLVDRQGADLIAYQPRRHDVIREVKGRTYPIHDAAVGGWSQRHHEAKVQQNWEHNAHQVADEVAHLAKAVEAQVILVAGDVRATELLLEALPSEWAERTVKGEGGRAPDGSADELADEAVRAAAAASARTTRDVLAKFKEEKGQADRAADGPAATLGALARAQVGLLLVHDDADDRRTAWFGPEAAHVGASRQDLVDMGVADPREGRLVDVAIRAALGTGADVRVVPEHGGPTGGVGAVLRWS